MHSFSKEVANILIIIGGGMWSSSLVGAFILVILSFGRSKKSAGQGD